MSYFDLEAADPRNQIVTYIIELRHQGCFLPYHEYRFVSQWLHHANGDVDKLMLVLSEVLPSYFAAKTQKNQRPRSLAGANKAILSRLDELAIRGVIS